MKRFGIFLFDLVLGVLCIPLVALWIVAVSGRYMRRGVAQGVSGTSAKSRETAGNTADALRELIERYREN